MTETNAATPMVRLDNVSKSYGAIHALRPISLDDDEANS